MGPNSSRLLRPSRRTVQYVAALISVDTYATAQSDTNTLSPCRFAVLPLVDSSVHPLSCSAWLAKNLNRPHSRRLEIVSVQRTADPVDLMRMRQHRRLQLPTARYASIECVVVEESGNFSETLICKKKIALLTAPTAHALALLALTVRIDFNLGLD